MAVKVLTLADLTPFDSFVAVDTEAATVATDGFEVTIDDDILILAQNSGAVDRTLTVELGNALQGVVDTTSSNIGAGALVLIKLNTGRYKNLSGTNKGKILLTPSHVELKVKAIKY